MKKKKIILGTDLSQRLEMLIEGASLPALTDGSKDDGSKEGTAVPVVDGDAESQLLSKRQRTS